MIYKVSQAVTPNSWRKKVRKCKVQFVYTSCPRPLLSLHSFRKWFVFSWVFCGLGYFNLLRNLKPSHSQWYSLPHLHLKGQFHRILTSGFLWICFDNASEYPIREVTIFLKICVDICSSRCTIGVIDTGGKSSTRKILIIFFQHLWVVELIFRYIPLQVHFKVKLVWILFPIFATGVVDTGGKLPLLSFTVLLTRVANLPLVLTTPAVVPVGKFNVDVVDTSGAPWLANISKNF